MSSENTVMYAVFFQYFILLLFVYKNVHCDSENCNKKIKTETDYFLTVTSHTSQQKVIAKKNVRNLNDCKRIARERKGMAFSYKSYLTLGDAYNKGLLPFKKQNMYSCIVYECPEVENSTSLVHDLGYDYYSIFANPIPPENATCIPRLGVFVLHTIKTNYYDAKEKCQEYGAVLPDIATEKRTYSLADMLENLLPKGSVKETYVGLENMDETHFIRSNDEKLTCSTFRAWAPGHPRRLNESCVLLKSNRMWKTVDCKTQKYFICEIYPGGWLENYDYFDYYFVYPL